MIISWNSKNERYKCIVCGTKCQYTHLLCNDCFNTYNLYKSNNRYEELEFDYDDYKSIFEKISNCINTSIFGEDFSLDDSKFQNIFIKIASNDKFKLNQDERKKYLKMIAILDDEYSDILYRGPFIQMLMYEVFIRRQYHIKLKTGLPKSRVEFFKRDEKFIEENKVLRKINSNLEKSISEILKENYEIEEENKGLTRVVEELKLTVEKNSSESNKEVLNINEIFQKYHIDSSDKEDGRLKWPAIYRCDDGHYCRSRAERDIDNWLFKNGVIHVYEKQIIFDNLESRYCDFYVPKYNLYIEFWGKNDPFYLNRKQEKLNLYDTLHGIELLQLSDKDIGNIGDILERHFKKYELMKK